MFDSNLHSITIDSTVPTLMPQKTNLYIIRRNTNIAVEICDHDWYMSNMNEIRVNVIYEEEEQYHDFYVKLLFIRLKKMKKRMDFDMEHHLAKMVFHL